MRRKKYYLFDARHDYEGCDDLYLRNDIIFVCLLYYRYNRTSNSFFFFLQPLPFLFFASRLNNNLADGYDDLSRDLVFAKLCLFEYKGTSNKTWRIKEVRGRGRGREKVRDRIE